MGYELPGLQPTSEAFLLQEMPTQKMYLSVVKNGHIWTIPPHDHWNYHIRIWWPGKTWPSWPHHGCQRPPATKEPRSKKKNLPPHGHWESANRDLNNLDIKPVNLMSKFQQFHLRIPTPSRNRNCIPGVSGGDFQIGKQIHNGTAGRP